MSDGYRSPSDKALSILLSWLTPEQRRDFAKYNYFYVTGNITGRRYRIRKPEAPFNVHEINFLGVTVRRLCFLPIGINYMGDIMLAQKIALEKDEAKTLTIANDYQNWMIYQHEVYEERA